MARVDSTGGNGFQADNGTGLQVRTKLNQILAALSTLNQGSGTPSVGLAAYVPFIDGNNLNIRNAANNANVLLGDVSLPNFGHAPLTGATFTGSVIHNYTGALRLPVGTTAQRPGSPATGDIRFNSTTTSAEIYDGSSFTAVGGGGTTINNNADNRVITGSGTANTLNGESSVVIDANGKLGIGTSSPTLSSSAYQGLHIHQTASGGAKGSQIHLTNDYGGSAATDGSHISHYNNYLYINNQENGSTYFFNNGSPTATILANGNFGVGTQAPVKKLDVNGDIKASSIYLGGTGTANQLDDYEEGTWTPSFTQGFSLTNYRADYTKIGRLVTAYCYVRILGNFSGNNNAFEIHGLPFNASGNYNNGGGFIGYMKNSNYSYPLLPLVGQNNNFINLHRQDGTTATFTYADMHNIGNGYNGEIIITVIYKAAT